MGDRYRALVMYSGGLDSTLAAARILASEESALLVTCDVRGAFGVERSRKNVERLRAAFPARHVEHRIVNCDALRRRIWEGFADDYFQYCSSGAPGILCLACKMAMLGVSLDLCLREGIPVLANGMSSTESDHPECKPRIVNRFADLMGRWGVAYRNEVYEIEARSIEEERLAELGIRMGLAVGSSSVTHQPRCVLGVYSTLWKAAHPLDEADLVRYFDARQSVVEVFLHEQGHHPADAPAPAGTRVDEARTWKHAHEFGERTDRTLGLALSPLWWLSRAGIGVMRRRAP